MSENELSFRSLNEIEIADLNLQLARLKQIAADVGVQLFADGREPDLDVLSLLASDLKWPEHETAIILVGLAFGQILAAGAPLSWGLEKNEWGEEMSLKLAGYEVFI